MREAINASRREFEALMRDGVLAPATAVPGVRWAWRLSEGLSFIAELENIAVLHEQTGDSWEYIHQAHLRSGLTVGKIIELIYEERIAVSQDKTRKGYQAFIVRLNDLDALLNSSPRRIRS